MGYGYRELCVGRPQALLTPLALRHPVVYASRNDVVLH